MATCSETRRLANSIASSSSSAAALGSAAEEAEEGVVVEVWEEEGAVEEAEAGVAAEARAVGACGAGAVADGGA